MSASQSSSGVKRKIHPTEEMMKLVHTTEICIEGDTVSIYNGSEDPIKVKIDGDSFTVTSELKQQIVDTFRVDEDAAIEWCSLFAELIITKMQEENENTEEEYYTKLKAELDSQIHDSDYAEFLITTIKRTVKQEDSLVRQIVYTGISKDTADPINLAVIAPTSEGKTYAVFTSIFPQTRHLEDWFYDTESNNPSERYTS